MSLSITLYTVAKRRNSTFRPSTGGLPVIGEFKEQTSLIEPSVYLAPVMGVSFTDFNYCYVSDVGRYYWITDLEWLNGRYLVRLKVDVLATYKAEIATSSQYVLRAASSYNGYIADNLYPRRSNITLGSYVLGTGIRQNLENGYFIIGIICPDGSILGSVTYYVLNWKAALALRVALLTDASWTNVTEITDELLQTLFNPFQYIASFKWFPVAPPAGSLIQVTDIKFGYWTFSITTQGAVVYQYASASLPAVTSKRYDVAAANIPNHPQIARGRFLNGPGFAEYYLQMTGYGKMQLPNDAFVAGWGLSIYETIDFVSGDSILNVYIGAGADETSTPVISAHSHMGVDMPYGSSDQDILTAAGAAVNGLTGAVGSLLSGNFGGIITSAVSGIIDAAHDVAPTIQTGGRSGSFAALGEYAGLDIIECIFHPVVDDDNADLGRPLCETRTLGNLSGFILCANPHIAISGTLAEAEEVDAFLAAGFFYE